MGVLNTKIYRKLVLFVFHAFYKYRDTPRFIQLKSDSYSGRLVVYCDCDSLMVIVALIP